MPKPRSAAPAAVPPAAAPAGGAAADPAAPDLVAPDLALERLRLYLLRLDPAAGPELPARLAAVAARAEARLAGRPPVAAEARAALLLAEARALYAAAEPAAGPALPAEAPAAMPEARLHYHQPLRALRARLAALVAAPASKPARER
jgi:hypothetical protein